MPHPHDASDSMHDEGDVGKMRRKALMRFKIPLVGAIIVISLMPVANFIFFSKNRYINAIGIQSFLIKQETLKFKGNMQIDWNKDAGFCPETSCPAGAKTTLIREAWKHAPDAPDRVEQDPSNKWATVTIGDSTFEMLTRDSSKDTFISRTIQAGEEFDAHVLSVLVSALNETSVFIDIGANIGYFSSVGLSLGSRVISFEPSLENAGTFMSTVRRNGWKPRSTLYMNAVSYESSRVEMKSTNSNINLSNMRITNSFCVNEITTTTPKNATYGLDYMDAVSLDQVMLQHHADIEHVHAMKIDVEMFEIQVMNGGMYFLCNRRVDLIVMEIMYLKSQYYKGPCQFSKLQNSLERMGFDILDPTLTVNFTSTPLDNFTSNDVVFRQRFKDEPPAIRLRGSPNNPCEGFGLRSNELSDLAGVS